jgi:hypothetical protein
LLILVDPTRRVFETSVMANDDPILHAVARLIQIAVNEKGRCLVTLPAELVPLKALGSNGLRQFAAEHGWNAVPRLGFTQIEFFATHLPPAAAGLV